MAVSMNTGGYMRSDFMISDAAIPQRMEELDAKAQDFSQYLSGTEQQAVQEVAQTVEGEAQQELTDNTAEPDTIPEQMLAKPSKLKSEESTELSEAAAAELAALLMQNTNAQAEAVPEVAEADETLVETVVEAVGESIQPAAAQEQLVMSEPKTETKSGESAPQFVVSAEEGAEIPAVQAAAADADSDAGTQLGSSDRQFTREQAAALSKAAEKGELGRAEARTVEKQPDTQQENLPEKALEEQPEQQVSVFSDRIKSASDELEMLKNAKAKPEQETVRSDVSPESDTPVVFTRENGEEVSVRPSEVVRQAEMRIIDTAKQMENDETEYSMVLNPEELGKITVKLTKAADGAVSVTIAAENSKTQQLLEQHSELMQDNLRNSGVRLESWQTVNESQQETYAQDYNGSSKNPYYRDDSPSEDEEDTTFAEIMASM